MSYMALYRKWRPDSFLDVKGQDHIVTTLKNQIEADRIGHAYLFCGTRGTGKTTVAKIFAKAVNCEHPVDGNPCNECASCRAVRDGVSMNVIEIDAASNNGVDNIRDIREEVQYSPTEGKYKVYIIDEVHMLSIGAFNALLKTLEEPPSYVIFILATTEVHKIPVTILSRCQRYDFKRISVETISDRLTELMVAENIDVEDRAIKYIAKAADGAMRDALSLLDQCLAFYIGRKLTYENVLETLGAVDTEVFSKLFRKIIMNDTKGALNQLEEIIMTGRELSQFVVDFTWYMRNLLLIQTTEDATDIIDVSAENLKALTDEAHIVEPEVLMRYIRVFSELSGQIRNAVQKRVMVEIALIKLMRPAMETNLESVLNRLSIIEKQLEDGVTVRRQETQPEEQSVTAEEKEEIKNMPMAVSEDVQAAVNALPSLIPKMDVLTQQFIRYCRYQTAGESRLVLVSDNSVAVEFFQRQQIRERVEEVIASAIKKRIIIESKLISESGMQKNVFIKAQEMIQMPIEELAAEDENIY